LLAFLLSVAQKIAGIRLMVLGGLWFVLDAL